MSAHRFSSIKIRTISAILAVVIMYGLYYFFDILGLVVLIGFSHFVLSRESFRLLIPNRIPMGLLGIFYFINLAIFLLTSFFPEISMSVFMVASVLFCVIALLFMGRKGELAGLVDIQTRSIFAFIYSGILPAMTVQLLLGPRGLTWFLTLLCIVFFGDVFAYLAGLTMGRRKMMPLVSPNKTLEGSLGGLLGSMIAALIINQSQLINIPFGWMILLGLVAGFVAQFGDLFESSLKRIAKVKDSGNIMPGHGGLLDRLDGVLFATPIVLIAASLFEKFY